MKVYLTKGPAWVLLQARAEGAEAIGDMTTEIRPGESAFGKTYEEWRSLPEGPHQIGEPNHG